MECGKMGHFKCTSESRSKRVRPTFDVKNDLNEFLINSNDEAEVDMDDAP
jgi:hypothetical protein